MTATPAPALTAAELARVQAFDAAPYPAEVAEAALVETVARAIFESDGLGITAWESETDVLRHEYRANAAAAIAAYRAAQDGGAEEALRRVEALASEIYTEGVAEMNSGAEVAARIRAALGVESGAK